MGAKTSTLTKDDIEEYTKLTFLTKHDVIGLHKKFHKLSPTRATRSVETFTVPLVAVEEIPELAVNPFKDRICRIFSTCDNDQMSFENFLDMMSTFSAATSKSVKMEYAFRIYDFDGDEMLGVDDIAEVIQRVTNRKLSEDDTKFVVKQVLQEADFDQDGKLSFGEFETVVSKSPDFSKSFYIFLDL